MRKSCRLLTKDDKPCAKTAVKGFHFCWTHLLQTAWHLSAIELLVGAALGAAASWAVSASYYTRSATDAAVSAHRSLPRQLPTVHSYPARVVIGGNVMDVAGPNPMTMRGVPGFDVGLNSTFRFSEDGVLHLDLEIRDAEGNVVAFVNDSQLFVQPGLPGYDINSDLDAFEVVDPEHEPILQLARIRGANSFELREKSFTRRGNALYVSFCDAEGCQVQPATKAAELRLGTSIFEYPGYLHPGKRSR